MDSVLANEDIANENNEGKVQDATQNDPVIILAIVLSSLLLFWSISAFFFPLGESNGSVSDLNLLILPKAVGILVTLLMYVVLSHTNVSQRPKTVFVISFATFLFPVCLAIDACITGGSAILRMAAFVIFGVGQACLVSMWAACISIVLDNKQIGICTVFSAVISIVMFIGIFVLYKQALVACMFFALVVTLVLIFYFSSMKQPKAINASDNQDVPSASSFLNSNVSNSECDRPSKKLFIFIAIQGVIYGVFFVALLTLPLSVLPILLCGSLLGAVLAYFAEISKWRISLSPNLGQRILAIVITVALVLCVLGIYFHGKEIGVFLCLGLLLASGTFFLVTSYMLLVVQSKEFGYSTVLNFSAGRTPVWSGMTLGMVIGIVSLLFATFDDCFVVLSCLLLVAQVISSSVHRPVDPVIGHAVVQETQKETEPEPDSSNKTAVGAFKTAALQMAHDCSLTPREEEIYLLLLKGRNSRYLQETLFISESTAKTHISNIYRKVGVRSKQELINQVEQSIKQAAVEKSNVKTKDSKKRTLKQ